MHIDNDMKNMFRAGFCFNVEADEKHRKSEHYNW